MAKPSIPPAKKMAHQPKGEPTTRKPHNPANNLGKFLHPAKKK